MIAGVINTNVNALYALNSLTNTANKTNTLEQELSSGQSINSPSDNPAGYIAARIGFILKNTADFVIEASFAAQFGIDLVEVGDVVAVPRDHDDLVLAQFDGVPGVLDEGRDVGRDEVFSVTDADHER